MIAMFISTESDGRYYHLVGRLVEYSEAKDEFRGMRDDTLESGLYVSQLRIWSQGNVEDSPRNLYGWDAEFHDCYTVDLPEAIGMVATLTKIDKHLKRCGDRDGACHTFGQYVLRVCRALGIDQMLFTGKYGHQLVKLGDGAGRIDHMVYDWVNQCNQPAVVA